MTVYNGFFLNLLLLAQCKKETGSALPPESTSGVNKAGCLVDGRVLVPRDARGRAGTALGLQLGTTAQEASFYLSLRDEADSSQPFVEVRADSMVLEEGKSYSFSASVPRGVVQGSCFTQGGYPTAGPRSGTLPITRLDRQAKLLAGSFEFVGTDRTTGKQVRVSAGRFDFQVQ